MVVAPLCGHYRSYTTENIPVFESPARRRLPKKRFEITPSYPVRENVSLFLFCLSSTVLCTTLRQTQSSPLCDLHWRLTQHRSALSPIVLVPARNCLFRDAFHTSIQARQAPLSTVQCFMLAPKCSPHCARLFFNMLRAWFEAAS